MKWLRCIGVVLFVVTTAGCAAQRPATGPLELPPKPVVLKGVSFMPPDEQGWYILGRTPYQIAMVRMDAGADETQAIQGKVVILPGFASDQAFVAAVKDAQAQDTDIADPDRFRIQTHDVTLQTHGGEACARSHIVSEDHGAVKRTATAGDMVLEIYALVCRHPDNRNAGISVDYSERYYPGSRNAGIDGKAKALLDSVRFAPLQ